jgi:hypothetical protein
MEDETGQNILVGAIIIQYREAKRYTVWPFNLATREVIYTIPMWSDRKLGSRTGNKSGSFPLYWGERIAHGKSIFPLRKVSLLSNRFNSRRTGNQEKFSAFKNRKSKKRTWRKFSFFGSA